MARTPLMREVQRAADIALESEWTTTRSGPLRRAGIAGLGLAAYGHLAPAVRAAAPSRSAAGEVIADHR